MTAEWITAIASLITALGLVGIVYQIRLAQKQLKADHERSRREKAIELLTLWDSNLSITSATARKFVESLGFEEAKSLYAQESFEISPASYNLFLGAISPESAEKRPEIVPDENIIITPIEAQEIRWAATKYLNQLETTFTAVRNNIADREIVYEQFHYLISERDGSFVMDHYRKASGGIETYPSIEQFVQDNKGKLKKVPAGKEKTA